ncbi:MAG: ATP--guanido phosphotransferase [Acutalibacteraceae bacterium]|nr:ATP--guanido phosphotransferase [Acutalibacteraceae bacterium]
MSKWYQLSGSENDTAICTKVALARNIAGHNFTIRLSTQEKDQIAEEVENALEQQLPGKFEATRMKDFPRDAAISLAERGTVSPEFISSTEGRTFITSRDESLTVMVCEEDHLKIQAMLPGLELDKSYALADQLDTVLDESLGFSFDKKLGYLTQCPTNIGTAMRASVMLQLPALHIRGTISNLARTVSKLGLRLTGSFGVGSRPVGSLYTLSNQMTLGISEEAALANLKSFSLSIIQQERDAREELMSNLRFQDMLWRSYGTLKNARVMSYSEFMEALSVVRIGIANGEIDLPMTRANELIFSQQPATLNSESDDELDRQKRDELRAREIRGIFEDKAPEPPRQIDE